MKFIFSFFCSVLLLFAEISVFDENLSENIYKNIAPSDENTDFESEITDPFVAQSSLVLKFDEYKTSFYVGEVFPIVFYAKTNENVKFDFNLSIESNNIKFLNPEPKWEYENSEYKTILWFEATSSNASLDKISLSLLRNNKAFQEASVILNPIKFINTPQNKDFSHIVASFLEVKKLKASYFDEENLIAMIELNATNTNLKSFFINDIKKQGVENLKGDFNASTAFYYAILPLNKSEFEFSYFNKEEKKLENIKLKLVVKDEELSTQSDLNPTNKDFDIYKQYSLWALSFVFALLFVWRKNYFVLILALLCFALSFIVVSNTKTATLKQGIRAKILPTEPSTYFYTSKANEKVEILDTRKDYVKILLSNGKIGWVRKNDLQKD